MDEGAIDTFVPENYPNFTVAQGRDRVREPENVAVGTPRVLWGTSGLPDGEHILELIVSGQKNQESTGTFVGIDEVVITSGTAAAQRITNPLLLSINCSHRDLIRRKMSLMKEIKELKVRASRSACGGSVKMGSFSRRRKAQRSASIYT